VTTPNPTLGTPKRWYDWTPRVIALLSLGLIIYGVSEYVRGVPDSYHNEKSRSLLLAVALFTQSITDEFKSPKARWTTMGAAMGLVAAVMWLSFT
jgi:hypothetical protein